MTSVQAPKVTCIITAYNVERWIGACIESALGQDWPADRLEVIVVNDGSTDATDTACAPYLDRIRYFSKENGGVVSATNVGLEHATGDYIATLDGDDTWPVDKLRRQVAILEERPEVGLLHGDMTIVAEDGTTVLHPSFFAHKQMDAPRGRVLGRLMHGNFVNGGATVVRASLHERFYPIPPESPYQDWYIAVRVAEVAEIDYVDFSVNNYRLHGANHSLGATGDKFVAAVGRDVPWQLWMLRNLDTSQVPVQELGQAFEILMANTRFVAGNQGVRGSDLLPPVGDEQRARSAELSERASAALAAGHPEAAARAWFAALALDPWNGAARTDLQAALVTLARTPQLAPRPRIDARSLPILAFAEELLESPDMVKAYGEVFGENDDATLVIQAPTAGLESIAGELEKLVGDASADMLVHPCDDASELLGAGLRAVYTRREIPPALAPLDRWSP